jgi:hypothetical protein
MSRVHWLVVWCGAGVRPCWVPPSSPMNTPYKGRGPFHVSGKSANPIRDAPAAYHVLRYDTTPHTTRLLVCRSRDREPSGRRNCASSPSFSRTAIARCTAEERCGPWRLETAE